MKTKISIAAVLVVTVLFLAGCQSSTSGTEVHSDIGNQAAPAADLITQEEARDIALKDAGFTADAVTDLRIELDEDDGVVYYEVDFRKDNYEYDYEIDAATGKIVGFDKDQQAQQSTTATEPAANESAASTITPEEAQKIALEDAGFTASQVSGLRVELDKDDGVTHYDVDFRQGDYEYDYEINAATGKIIKSDRERETVTTSATTTSSATAATSTISKSKAQSIALDHAGLKASDVTGLKVTLDKDDGVTHYDVEFRKDHYEYDYEINATTGKIIEWDKDWDD